MGIRCITIFVGSRSDYKGAIIMPLKIWSKQLLMIRPPDVPYLMGSPRVILAYDNKNALIYPNTPQVISDTLSYQMD